MKKSTAGDTFSAGYNCSQSVLIPFLKEFNIPEETGYRIASVFGAGMGRMQETCGAVTGAFMVLGLKYGFTRPDDQQGRDTVLKKTREFTAHFKQEFGTILCRELLKCDLNTDEGQRIHKDEKQRELICMKCVSRSAEILDRMMAADK